MTSERLLQFELTRSFTPADNGLPIGRGRFQPYLNGRSFATGMQYQGRTIDRTSSVSWRLGMDVPREHDRSRGGNRKH